MTGAEETVTAQLLTGKVALLLGASRGIGEGIARAAYAAGAKLVIGSRDLDALTALAQNLDHTGGNICVVRADMTDAASLEQAVATTVDRFGRLDIAFNNAGYQSARTPFLETTDEMFDQSIAVNLRGVFVAMKHQVRAMLATGNGGSIVNTASILGMLARPLIAPYIASKHGLIGLTKAVAVELASQGIRANAIAPGPVMTEMLRLGPASSPEALQKLMDGVPMARLGTIEEIATAAVWLASDQTTFITGVTLPLDGGATLP